MRVGSSFRYLKKIALFPVHSAHADLLVHPDQLAEDVQRIGIRIMYSTNFVTSRTNEQAIVSLAHMQKWDWYSYNSALMLGTDGMYCITWLRSEERPKPLQPY